jgi:hypothetical protein
LEGRAWVTGSLLVIPAAPHSNQMTPDVVRPDDCTYSFTTTI